MGVRLNPGREATWNALGLARRCFLCRHVTPVWDLTNHLPVKRKRKHASPALSGASSISKAGWPFTKSFLRFAISWQGDLRDLGPSPMRCECKDSYFTAAWIVKGPGLWLQMGPPSATPYHKIFQSKPGRSQKRNDKTNWFGQSPCHVFHEKLPPGLASTVASTGSVSWFKAESTSWKVFSGIPGEGYHRPAAVVEKKEETTQTNRRLKMSQNFWFLPAVMFTK